jgi:hypothetical protein
MSLPDWDSSPSELIGALRDAQQAVLAEIIEMAQAQHQGRPVNRDLLESLLALVRRFWSVAACLVARLKTRGADASLIRRATLLADFFEQIEDEVVVLLCLTSGRDELTSS